MGEGKKAQRPIRRWQSAHESILASGFANAVAVETIEDTLLWAVSGGRGVDLAGVEPREAKPGLNTEREAPGVVGPRDAARDNELRGR